MQTILTNSLADEKILEKIRMQSGGSPGGGGAHNNGKANVAGSLNIVSALYYDNYAYAPSLTSIPGHAQQPDAGEGVKEIKELLDFQLDIDFIPLKCR